MSFNVKALTSLHSLEITVTLAWKLYGHFLKVHYSLALCV